MSKISGLRADIRQQIRGADSVKELARKIQKVRGGLFDVSELEGFEGRGQISSGHAPNSLHYAGRAMDVNVTRGNEKKKLAELAAEVKRQYGGQLDEFLGPWNNAPGHADHGHFGFKSRKL